MMQTKPKEGRTVAHKTEKAQVRIDPALRRALNVIAAEQGVPPYTVTEQAVREYLERRKPALLARRPMRR
jgi:predicted transcriptional regulator